MRLFNNLPIALKILMALGLMTILAVALAAGSVRELSRLNEVTQKLSKDDARSLYLASAANERMTRAKVSCLRSSTTSAARKRARSLI